MWQTEIGNYGSFFVLYPPLLKIQIIRILKYYHFTQVYQKPQSYEVQFLRYGVRQTKFLVIFGHFLPLYPPKNQKNQNFKTIKKKHREMSSLYTCVPKITIIWCMLPEIWNTRDLIFYHFGPFFALLPHYWPQK